MKTTFMADSGRKQSDLNHFCGTGASSRISLEFEKLWNAGWTITERKDSSQRTHYKYVSPAGRSVKSAKDMERKLLERGYTKRVLEGGRFQRRGERKQNRRC